MHISEYKHRSNGIIYRQPGVTDCQPEETRKEVAAKQSKNVYET